MKIETINVTDNISADMMKFDIEKPTLNTWFFIIISIICMYALLIWLTGTGSIFIIVSVIFAIVLLISTSLWLITSKIQIKSVYNQFKFRNNKKPLGVKISGFFLSLIGFKLNQYNEYYVELAARDFTIKGYVDTLKTRLKDVIFTSVGMSFVLTTIVQLIIPDIDVLIVLNYVVFIAPALLFWLVPLIWTLEDAQIRTINPEDGVISDELLQNVRHSRFSYFLGFGGLLYGIGFIMEIFADETIFIKIFYSIVILFITIVYLLGISYTLTIIYLVFIHEKRVNTFRKSISDVVPLGISMVNKSENQIFCRNCSYKGDSKQNFCKKCGKQLKHDSCPNCSNPIGTNQKFCKKCGVKL